MRLVLTAVFFLAFASPVSGEIRQDELPPVAELFAAPCLELGIPCPVAMAIARVESGLHPWSLNIEGQSFRFKSKAEALAKARSALAAGRSFDVGLMQVNSWWLKRYGIALEAALDPLANIYLGGWILKQEINRHKNLRAAVGAYHSPNPDKARRYAEVVMAALERGPVKPPPRIQPRPKSQGASAQKPAPKSAGPDNRRMLINKDLPPRYTFTSPTSTSSTMKVRSKIK
ncbi:lytic transglycosylase domain-containing protein [Deltaproteobacteria bacterium OttesenSCG-928-K17]|nr:lytic transglycosylase domain-containing protein [Deltaproteobacteria bacterium OttesenSCG-928-K17]